MPVAIARASEADIDFIMATERTPGYEGLVGRWEREEHERALADSSNAFFIGSVAGAPAGFVIVQYWASDDRATLIKRIIVADTGQKLGRELLTGVIDAIFSQTGALRVWLNVYPHNARAQRSYAAIGFRFEDGAAAAARSNPGANRMLVMGLSRQDWLRQA